MDHFNRQDGNREIKYIQLHVTCAPDIRHLGLEDEISLDIDRCEALSSIWSSTPFGHRCSHRLVTRYTYLNTRKSPSGYLSQG